MAEPDGKKSGMREKGESCGRGAKGRYCETHAPVAETEREWVRVCGVFTRDTQLCYLHSSPWLKIQSGPMVWQTIGNKPN